MSVSTANRTSQTSKIIQSIMLPIAAGVHIWQYTFVATDAAGNLNPVSDTAGLNFAGYALQEVNNPGAAGAASCPVVPPERDRYQVLNVNAANADKTWVGKRVFWDDDHSVFLTGSSTNHICAGTVVDFLAAGSVTVDIAKTGSPATS